MVSETEEITVNEKMPTEETWTKNYHFSRKSKKSKILTMKIKSDSPGKKLVSRIKY